MKNTCPTVLNSNIKNLICSLKPLNIIPANQKVDSKYPEGYIYDNLSSCNLIGFTSLIKLHEDKNCTPGDGFYCNNNYTCPYGYSCILNE